MHSVMPLCVSGSQHPALCLQCNQHPAGAVFGKCLKLISGTAPDRLYFTVKPKVSPSVPHRSFTGSPLWLLRTRSHDMQGKAES